MVSTGDRGQPKLSASIFCDERRLGAASVGLDEARSAINAGLALNPTFAVSRFRANSWPRGAKIRGFWTQLEPILEGLRKAGLPEE